MGNRWDYEKCKSEILGEENFNSRGQKMTIVEYNGQRHIKVLFENGELVDTNYHYFKKGWVRNRNSPNVLGVGITGNEITKINGKRTKEYSMWHNMLARCYSNDSIKAPAYKNVSCCEDWLYFSNFVSWCHTQENWENVIKNQLEFHLDKDILEKGNKVYCPEKCCIVPRNVNILFTKRGASRGDTPIGVHPDNRKEKGYYSLCSNPYGADYTHYGFTNVHDAFLQYKADKETVIRKMAEREYLLGNITKKCYESMMNYEVEITD